MYVITSDVLLNEAVICLVVSEQVAPISSLRRCKIKEICKKKKFNAILLSLSLIYLNKKIKQCNSFDLVEQANEIQFQVESTTSALL